MEKKQIEVCCICGKKFEISRHFWGNNPEPIKPAFDTETEENQVCCDECNKKFVIPARLTKEI